MSELLTLKDTPRQMQDKLKPFMYETPPLDLVDFIRRSMEKEEGIEEDKKPSSPTGGWIPVINKALKKKYTSPMECDNCNANNISTICEFNFEGSDLISDEWEKEMKDFDERRTTELTKMDKLEKEAWFFWMDYIGK